MSSSLLGAAALAIAGCGDEESAVPANQAVAQYQAMVQEILAALVAVRPLTWEHTAQEVLGSDAEDCRYQPGVWEADGTLYPQPGQGIDWEPWRESLDPVLEEHGFTALGREQVSGDGYWLESTGAHGALLQLHAEGRLLITDIRVVAEPCEDAALGL